MRCELLGLSAWEIGRDFFVLGDAEIAIEVKGRLQARETRNLLQFRQEHPGVRQLILVCLEERARITDEDIHLLPLQEFLDRLWIRQLL